MGKKAILTLFITICIGAIFLYVRELNTTSVQSNTDAIQIEIVRNGSGLPALKDDLIKQELDDRLDVNINLALISNDYKEHLNVLMNAANYPDLIEVDRQDLVKYSRQGLLLDLTKYYDELTQVKEFISSEQFYKGAVDEILYGISVPTGIPFGTYWIRKDWLDNLGLEPPSNVDEFYQVAMAFTEQDPDQNGIDDTMGLTGNQLEVFEPIFGAFGVGKSGSFYYKNGKLINSFYDPDMKDALEYIQSLIEIGVVDPELITNSALEHQEKAFQGKFGIIYIDWSYMLKDNYQNAYKKINPEAEWIQLGALTGPGGQYNGSWDASTVRRYFAIPSSLEKEPEKLQKVLELLNYVSSEEGAKLVQFGVEGIHYLLKDDAIIPDSDKDTSYFWLYQFTGRPEMDYLMTKYGNIEEHIVFASNQPYIQIMNGLIDIPEYFHIFETNRFAEEQLFQFMYNKRPLSEYEDFLETLESDYDYNVYIEDAKEQIRKSNM